MSYIRYNLHLDMQVTDVCNFGCPWCAYDSGRSQYVLPLEKAREVMEEARSYNIKEVHIYGGEVLHLDSEYIRSLLKIAREYFDHVGLLTKGHPLDKFRLALEYLDSVFISLHPTLPTTFEAVKLASASSVKTRTSVVVDKVVIKKDPMFYISNAYYSGADNIAFMYMSPVSEFLDPTTWRRSLSLWVEPKEWLEFIRSLKERVPKDLQDFVRVQPAYSKSPKGCEVHEYVRRVVYFKGKYYLCHMAIESGLGGNSIKEALDTRGLYEKHACVGYINIAKNVLGIEKDYRLLVGLPENYMPECPMRTVKLIDIDQIDI